MWACAASCLFPMFSLSLSRASSAASWEANCTNASPEFLPKWSGTMVTPFSAISKPEKKKHILNFTQRISLPQLIIHIKHIKQFVLFLFLWCRKEKDSQLLSATLELINDKCNLEILLNRRNTFSKFLSCVSLWLLAYICQKKSIIECLFLK